MLFISKKQLIPIDVNLVMVFICRLFQSRLQVGQFRSYGIFLILFMSRRLRYQITRVQYLTETLLRKIRRGKRQ